MLLLLYPYESVISIFYLFIYLFIYLFFKSISTTSTSIFIVLFIFIIYLFIYLFLAVLGLRFCARALSSCGKRGPLLIAVRGPLTIVASLVAEHRLQTRRLSSRGSPGSVAVAHGPSCSAACGIFPDQGSNPCPLHWQADSQPLCHQGSPIVLKLREYPRLMRKMLPSSALALCSCPQK